MYDMYWPYSKKLRTYIKQLLVSDKLNVSKGSNLKLPKYKDKGDIKDVYPPNQV